MAMLLLIVMIPLIASAQIHLRCNEKGHVFRPPGVADVDLKLPITSSAPNIATGRAGRVGMGTDGAIEIDAHGATGNATITYHVENRSTGAITTITVKVRVDCPPPPTPTPTPTPTNNPRIPPGGTPTHRQTNCNECKPLAKTLNDASDKLSQAQASGNQKSIIQLRMLVQRLSDELTACEKKCSEHKRP